MLSKSQIKLISSLHQKKCRDFNQLFMVEGKRMVFELMESHTDYLQQIVISETFARENKTDYPFEPEIVDTNTFKKISHLVQPQGVLAIFKQPELTYRVSDFVLVLDGVQDPGNMGTILRLADWFGVEQVICSKDCVDIFNTKVVQASMGSIFRVRVAYLDLAEFMQNNQLPVFGALLNGENIYKKQLQRKGLLVMGSEGNGISKEIQTYVKEALFIPQFGGGESLNVSMATAILLSEFSRT
jgi:TrmH family RNA methyltransferase